VNNLPAFVRRRIVSPKRRAPSLEGSTRPHQLQIDTSLFVEPEDWLDKNVDMIYK